MLPEINLGSWSISTYFLIIAFDFSLMLFWLRRRAIRRGFPVIKVLDIGMYASLVGFLGARLFHVFYELPYFYRNHPDHIFKLWEGGYVFLAGLLSAMTFGIFLLRREGPQLGGWLDLFAPVLGGGYALGRWACFFQGCCYGKPTPSALGVHFHNLQSAGETIARFPTQALTSLVELVLVVILLRLEKLKKDGRPLLKSGQIFALWLMGHGINRLSMELLRDDPRGPLWGGLGISFFMAFGLLLLGIYLYRLWSRSFNDFEKR